jgi:predicted AlkP superfamily pyrophosphatase or phosphodiesterase
VSPHSPAPPAGTTPRAAALTTGTRVLAISLDGLNPAALRRLGRARSPHLHRLFREGAGTRNARAQVEQTLTLPNHTSMVTGRRIDAAHGGHGVTWNVDLPATTVHDAAGEDVGSVFRVVHGAGGSTAVFSTKAKFSLFERSWPAAVGRTTIKNGDDRAVTRALRRDLVGHARAFTFLHLGLADVTGHAYRWMRSHYLRAVERLDRLVGSVLRTIRRHHLRSVVVVLTADHGGPAGSRDHSDPTRLANHRVPFVVWGAGVDHGDLYAMNPSYADPGRRAVGFEGTQPVRNGDLANLATDLLGLGPVPDSLWNADQALAWTS